MNYLIPQWKITSTIKAYTTLKSGWDGSDPALLSSLLPLPAEPIWLDQTHTNSAIEALAENRGKNADASFTREPNRICLVVTADCLPILLCNQAGTEVAAIHAGWRGLAQGIIEATLAKMYSPASHISAWLGPAISKHKFEVGQEVFDAFTQQHPASSTAFTPHIPGKYWADLYALARLRLQGQGVHQIYGGEYCTHTQEDLFFSYRREGAKTGRMATMIWIQGEE
jgi:polyphenol oxidase